MYADVDTSEQNLRNSHACNSNLTIIRIFLDAISPLAFQLNRNIPTEAAFTDYWTANDQQNFDSLTTMIMQLLK